VRAAPAFALAACFACAPVQVVPSRPDDVVETERIHFRSPGGAEWYLRSSADDSGRMFVFSHLGGDRRWDPDLSISVWESNTLRPGFKRPSREHMLELLAARARRDLRDPEAEVAETTAAAEPRFGPDALEVVVTARSRRLRDAGASVRAIHFVHAERMYLVMIAECGSPARSAAETQEFRTLVLERLALKTPPRASRTSPGRASRHQIRRVR
jgi:hypothetical protein